MARRLYKIIMMPAMGLTLFLGFWMLFLHYKLYFGLPSGWLLLKLFLVFLLIGYHHLAGFYLKRLEQNQDYSHKFFRVMNEGATVFLILIVSLAVMKPF